MRSFPGVDLLNIPNSVLSAAVWSFTRFTSRLDGAGLYREWIKSWIAYMAASIEDIFVMLNSWGKHLYWLALELLVGGEAGAENLD